MAAPPRRANGPRQYYSVPQSPASTSHYTQYTAHPQPQPTSHHQQRKARRQVRRVPPPPTNGSRSSHETRTYESRRGEMAHSVATGAIGGGYGPYSVRISFLITVADTVRLTLISNLWFTPLVPPSGLWTEFRPLHECEFRHIRDVYEREACIIECWAPTTTFDVLHGPRTRTRTVQNIPTTDAEPTHDHHQHRALYLGYQGP